MRELVSPSRKYSCALAKKTKKIYIYIVVQLRYLLQSLNQASSITFFVGIDILRP